jgi:alkanesulfonate monooxygenase SsuD/methylene tetrahydromethanopterin reductase-like flavin-dependent oxidoreductase (luciferase family)
MRRLWTEDHVTHQGARFAIDDVTLRPKPVQQPIDVWLGGQAPSELRRVGRLGDGWLPSFCTADDVHEGWEAVSATASEHGRTIDPEHLGALVTYSHVGVPDRVAALLAARRPGLAPAEVVPVGLDALRARLEGLIAAGASKFVVVPIDEPGQWDAELAAVMDALGDLQT